MAYLTLFSGLFISAVAIYYSVSGLTAIFAASVIPIIIMGTSLEVGKLIASVWLKQYWNQAPKLLRGYLLSAVAILMMITSMGIFGYLSKAHSDQSLVSGDVQSKIAVYDEKIKTEKDNIDVSRKSLKQMDEAVDQVMARSTSEGGADKAVAIRRSQQKERGRLLADISTSQQRIATLNETRAPIAAEVRKVEAEVGPIKYIAAFIYGDNPDAGILDKAVRWVIILIVIVFDPLAIILLLASQYSFEYERKKKDAGLEIFAGNPDIKMNDPDEFFDRAREVAQSIDNGTYVSPVYSPTGPITSWTTTTYEPDDGPLTDKQIEQIRETAKNDLPTGEVISKESLFEEPEEEFEQAHTPSPGTQEWWVNRYNELNDTDATAYDEHLSRVNRMLAEGSEGPAESTVTVEDPVKEEALPISDLDQWNKMIEQAEKAVKESNKESTTLNPWSMDERPGDYVDTAVDPALDRPYLWASRTVTPYVPPTPIDWSTIDPAAEYVTINGQKMHIKVAREKYPPPSGYVQNEEQSESGKWKSIVDAKAITEEEYLNKASENQKKI